MPIPKDGDVPVKTKDKAEEVGGGDAVKKHPSKPTTKGPDKKVVLIAACIIVVVIVGLLILIFGKKDTPRSEPTTDYSMETPSGDSTTPSVSDDVIGSTVDGDRPWLTDDSGHVEDDIAPNQNDPEIPRKSEGVVPGLIDISGDSVSTNDTPISEDTLTTDLDGNVITAKYEIGRINVVTDFVSYTKKRSKMGNGIEMYWLDSTYKGQKAKIQVPFKIFKEMDEVGIVPVDVEITQVELGDGEIHEIATYFTVRTDYKRILDEVRE